MGVTNLSQKCHLCIMVWFLDTYYSCPVSQACPALCDPMDCSMPGFPVSHHLLKLSQNSCPLSQCKSNHFILWRLLLLPSIFPCIRILSDDWANIVHIMLPNYWSFSFNISSSSEYSVLISIRLTGLILQSKGLSRVFSNTTVGKHEFFGAQSSLWSNSHSHMWLLRKVIALTIQTFVGNFSMLSRFVIAFLPRGKRLLISWLQSPSAVILEPPKIKPATVSIVSPSICHEVMRLDAMILVFWMLSFNPTFSTVFHFYQEAL